MFCMNCGKELAEDVAFCPDCGTKQMGIRDGRLQHQGMGADSEDKDQPQSVGVNLDGNEPNLEISFGNSESREKEPSRNIVFKIWNSPLFTKVAIKFGNVLEVLEVIIFIILSVLVFQEGGFWGIAFGLLFIVAGIGSCIGGVISLLSRRKSDKESEMLDEAAINKKKRNLCIGVVVIIIVLTVLKNSGGGTYYIVQSITFADMGSETIGELVDENIKSPKWSQKKLDSSSKLVYVEGYCPSYSETIRIEFFCEKLDDGSHEVSLKGMFLPDSNEELSAFEASIVWASFYN